MAEDGIAGKAKEEWDSIPTGVKIGVGVGIATLFLITKLRGGSTTTAPVSASPAATGTQTYDLTPSYVTGGSSTGSTVPSSSPTPAPTTTPSNPNNITNPLIVQPLPAGFTLPNPTTPGLSNSQAALQNQDINNLLGTYGGVPVQTTNPYASIAGSTWANVTNTTYSGGGNVSNLGYAQPTPKAGDVIPPAVQDKVIYGANGQVDWNATLAQAYTYPQGFTPGMTQQ